MIRRTVMGTALAVMLAMTLLGVCRPERSEPTYGMESRSSVTSDIQQVV